MEAGLFEGRTAHATALREAILAACAQGSREIFWLDEGFVNWPLSDAAVLDALTRWARRPRRLHLLALDFEDLRQRHPRFVQWRQTYDHCVEALAYEPEAAGGQENLASALFVSGGEQAISLRLFDTRLWRGALSLNAGDALRTKEWFDALAQRSSPSFAPTSLGL